MENFERNDQNLDEIFTIPYETLSMNNNLYSGANRQNSYRKDKVSLIITLVPKTRSPPLNLIFNADKTRWTENWSACQALSRMIILLGFVTEGNLSQEAICFGALLYRGGCLLWGAVAPLWLFYWGLMVRWLSSGGSKLGAFDLESPIFTWLEQRKEFLGLTSLNAWLLRTN